MPYLRPSFFIIGERKCGTSSLFRYLLEHPQVLPGERKEMQFFSQSPAEVAAHFEDYLQRFPERDGAKTRTLRWPELDARGVLFEEEIAYQRKPGVQYITGEASADTFAEVSPDLLKQYLPKLRLIVLLRDPVARAFSHHRMLQRFQDEGRDLPKPLRSFADDMRAEMAAAVASPGTLADTRVLRLGVYTEKLQAWRKAFGEDALLVLFTSDLQDPASQPALLERAREHLGLAPWPPREVALPLYNRAPPQAPPSDVQRELEDFYRPHNEKLRSYLGCELPWFGGSL